MEDLQRRIAQRKKERQKRARRNLFIFIIVVLAFKHIALVSLQVKVSLDAHLQAPPQRQRLLRH